MNLERQVRGALREAIRAHGPIDERWIESAAKRVVGQITSGASTAMFQALTKMQDTAQASPEPVSAAPKRPGPLLHGRASAQGRNLCRVRGCLERADWLVREKSHVTWRPYCLVHARLKVFAQGAEIMRLPDRQDGREVLRRAR